MSLIQDALKRQQEEMTQKGTAATPPAAPPAAPPAVPPPPRQEPPQPPPISMPKIPLRKNEPKAEPPAPVIISEPAVRANEPVPDPEKKKKQILVGVTMILLLALGITVYFGWPLLAGLLKPASQVPPQASTSRPDVPDPELAVASSSPPPVVALATTTGAPVASAPLMPADTNPAPPALAAGIPEPEPQPPTPLVAPSTEPEVTNALPADTGLDAIPVSWPPIKLTGFVKLGKTSAALINGKVVSAGETIEEVVMVKVTAEGALVRFQGEERVLRVGETAR